jgi:hypothetical protein
MATWHINELRAEFERRGWSYVELPGNDRDIAVSWELRRPADPRVLHIDFEGMDDLRTLPIAESYGCHVRENRDLTLYFRRQRARELWDRELALFVDGLEN